MKKIKYSKTEFTSSMLPSTRKEQFIDIIKQEWKTLLYAGIMLFLSFVPEGVLLIFKNAYLMGLYHTSEGADYQRLKIIVDLLGDVAQIVTLSIFFLGLAGFFRILRLLSWGEQVYFWSDFVNGIKKNFVRLFQLLLLSIIVLALNQIITYFISVLIPTTWNTILVVLIDSFDLLVLLPIGLYAISYSNIYADNFKMTIVNSFVLLMKSYIRVIWFIAIPIGLYFLFDIGTVWVCVVSVLVYLTILAPFAFLGMYLVHLNEFDKFVNDNYPEIKNKGLTNH